MARYGSGSRGGARPIWVVLHTAEGARTKESLANFFDGNPDASSHVGIDAGGFNDMIDSLLYAWTLGSGNRLSINGELCAFARWNRTQWLSTGVVDGCVNPRQIIRNAAAWARRECERWGIPKRILTVEQCAAGWSGIIDHRTYNLAYRAGDHTDVGNGHPWDVFYADLIGVSDMSASDVIGKRPDGSEVTLGEAVLNLYNGAYFGGGDAGARPVFAAVNDGTQALVEAYTASGKTKGIGLQVWETRSLIGTLGTAVATARTEITALKQQLADSRADTASALASISATLEGLETGTGTSVGEIARAVVAELKKEGN